MEKKRLTNEEAEESKAIQDHVSDNFNDNENYSYGSFASSKYDSDPNEHPDANPHHDNDYDSESVSSNSDLEFYTGNMFRHNKPARFTAD